MRIPAFRRGSRGPGLSSQGGPGALWDPGAMPPPAGPFDPDGVTWTPVSPRLATARRVLLSAFTVPAVIAVFVLAFATGEPSTAFGSASCGRLNGS